MSFRLEPLPLPAAIENIITTEDELFRTDSAPGGYGSVAAK